MRSSSISCLRVNSPALRWHAAAGKAAARVDHLTIHGHDLAAETIVPRHAGGLVDVIHHDDAAQQIGHDVM